VAKGFGKRSQFPAENATESVENSLNGHGFSVLPPAIQGEKVFSVFGLAFAKYARP
jgi:hypothetical protein